MRAYHGDHELKAALLREIAKHREQDRIVAGTYGHYRKGQWVGCAIGCSLRSLDIVRGRKPRTGSYGDHSRYEAELGIPCELAYLEDRLFERMPADARLAWPERFASAIEPGADIRLVWPRFAVWLLIDPTHGVERFARSDGARAAIRRVAALYQRRIDGFSNEEIAALFGVMAACPQHQFQLLTKRPERAVEWFEWFRGETVGDDCDIATALASFAAHELGDGSEGDLSAWVERLAAKQQEGWAREGANGGTVCDTPWPLPNVWLMTSTEDQPTANERLPKLLQCPAAVHGISYEPALGPVDLSRWIRRIDHCGSCGAENGPRTLDRCPSCGATSCLISTWGDDQHDAYRSGRRYDNGGPGRDGDGPQLSWVIAGAESGPGARTADLAWFRSVRDQCAAGVAFFMKQLVVDGKLRKELDEFPEDLRIREYPR